MLPLAIACALYFWWRYGTVRVPAGMDTMGAAFPPGALCLIDEHPAALRTGQVVFVDVDGQVMVSRVRDVGQDWVTIAHDQTSARWGDGRGYGRIPDSAVIGVVLTAFVTQRARPEGQPR